MVSAHLLPHLNAVLNGISLILLSTGWILIRRRRIGRHRACMLGSFGVSVLFLVSYVSYHALAGSRLFTGTGVVRPVYFTILTSHIILAAVIVPLAVMTIRRALRDERDRHRRIARWTLPLWLYVSLTGLLVYLLLYHVYPGTS